MEMKKNMFSVDNKGYARQKDDYNENEENN